MSGAPGSSARREYERRKAYDEERIRRRWGPLGRIAYLLSGEKQSTTAWERGAVGEERFGARLDAIASENIAVLHDRRIPRSRANIDHIVVTRGGVWVIDTKRYKGRPRLVVEGGLLRPRKEKLLIGTRDCTKLVDGVHRQMEHVKAVVGGVPVFGALCFVEVDWPLLARAFVTRGVHAGWQKRIISLLVSVEDAGIDVAAVHDVIANRFRPA